MKWPQQGEWAGATGLDQIRLHRSCTRPSTDRDLVNSVNVIDERAREVMVDVIELVALMVSEKTKRTDVWRCVLT